MDRTDSNGLSDEDYVGIGRVVVQAVSLEWLLDLMLDVVIGDKDVGFVLRVGAAWRWKVDKVRLLVRSRVPTPTVRDSVLAWVDRADEANNQRGRLVHSMWMPGKNNATGELFVKGGRDRPTGKSYGPRPVRYEEMTLDDVPPLLAELDSLNRLWLDIYEALRADLASGQRPKRGRPPSI